MRIKALKRFKDLNHNVYRKAGDSFEVSAERFEEINSTKYGQLVEKVKEEPSKFPKHTGGGWFELSNGERVKGKKEAKQAEKDL